MMDVSAEVFTHVATFPGYVILPQTQWIWETRVLANSRMIDEYIRRTLCEEFERT